MAFAVNSGTSRVRNELLVLGWSWREIGRPFTTTRVPATVTRIGRPISRPVSSMSHFRRASASPIRSLVPSSTSRSFCTFPFGAGPYTDPPVRHSAAARRTRSIWSRVSALGCSWLAQRCHPDDGVLHHGIVPKRVVEHQGQHDPAVSGVRVGDGRLPA